MSRAAIRVELFFAGGCSKCAESRDLLRQAAESIPRVEWSEVDVGRNPHRAADVGVISTPAVAIDGDLVFKSLPSASELQRAVTARSGKG